jgi:hypothetical protein
MTPDERKEAERKKAEKKANKKVFIDKLTDAKEGTSEKWVRVEAVDKEIVLQKVFHSEAEARQEKPKRGRKAK